VADHQLGAVVGVQLEGRVEHLVEGVGGSLALSVDVKMKKKTF
jgi:hypothetical protein